MTSEYFFLPRADVAGSSAVLRGAEYHHLVRVLRVRPGDHVWLFDEDGRRYRAEAAAVREKEEEIDLSILDVLPPRGVRTRIVLAPALLKTGAMDEVILRACELGASRISPVESERSVARSGDHSRRKVERWTRLARAAAKQSRAARVPLIDAPASLADFLASGRDGRRFFLCEHGGMSLKALRGGEEEPPAEATVLVGPEGGWSAREEEAIRAAEFEAVSLGEAILRAETSALAVLAVLAHEWNW